MHPRPQYPLKAILHPYVFVLKEGGAIKKDFLDYSLMMLFTHSLERIDSPEGGVKSVDTEDRIEDQIDEFDRLL